MSESALEGVLLNDILYLFTYMMLSPLHSTVSHARARTVFLGHVNTWLMNEFKNNGSFSGAHRPNGGGKEEGVLIAFWSWQSMWEHVGTMMQQVSNYYSVTPLRIHKLIILTRKAAA